MNLGMLIKAVPATFWGIVIGSLFTVMGVVLTNASNNKRLRLQHEHERDLRQRDRDLSLRRDIYLDAVEAISAGMVLVGRFGELDIPTHELMQSYMTKSPSIGKVTIVGDTETIKAVARFTQELTGAFMRLTSKREEVNLLRQHYMAIEKRIKRSSRDIHRLLAMIQEHNLTEERHGEEWDALQRDYESERQNMEELLAERAAADGQFAAAILDLIKKSVTEVAALDRLLAPVFELMRSELGLPFDQDRYLEIVEASHARLAEHLEETSREMARK